MQSGHVSTAAPNTPLEPTAERISETNGMSVVSGRRLTGFLASWPDYGVVYAFYVNLAARTAQVCRFFSGRPTDQVRYCRTIVLRQLWSTRQDYTNRPVERERRTQTLRSVSRHEVMESPEGA